MLNTESVVGGKEGGGKIDKFALVGGKWTDVVHDTRDGIGKKDAWSKRFGQDCWQIKLTPVSFTFLWRSHEVQNTSYSWENVR